MIQREVWQDPAQPVNGPSKRGTPGTWVIHYPGGPAGVVGAAVAPYLRNIQSAYVNGRGYSIGYNWGVAQDGSRWEIRGDDFNNAANAGRKVDGNFNDVSQSIFVMVDEQDAATPEAVAAVNGIIATHPDWDVIVHGDVDWTSCAGVGLTAQVRSGVIGHQVDEGEDVSKVALIIEPPANAGPNPPWLVHIDGATTYIGSEAFNQLAAAGVPVVKHNLDQYTHYRKAANLA